MGLKQGCVLWLCQTPTTTTTTFNQTRPSTSSFFQILIIILFQIFIILPEKVLDVFYVLSFLIFISIKVSSFQPSSPALPPPFSTFKSTSANSRHRRVCTFDENNYEFYQVAESPVLMTKTSSCLVSTLTGSDLLLTTEPQTRPSLRSSLSEFEHRQFSVRR